jgi:hypothetical protein
MATFPDCSEPASLMAHETLSRIAKALEIPVTAFEDRTALPLQTREVAELIELFLRLRSPEIRVELLDDVRAIIATQPA